MAVGMVVVLSALVLGLLIASVRNTFDTATRDLKHFLLSPECCLTVHCEPMNCRRLRHGCCSSTMWSRRSLVPGRLTTGRR